MFVFLLHFQRKLCHILYKVESIAKIPKTPAELSEEQVKQIGELAALTRSGDESSRAEAFVRILTFKNCLVLMMFLK